MPPAEWGQFVSPSMTQHSLLQEQTVVRMYLQCILASSLNNDALFIKGLNIICLYIANQSRGERILRESRALKLNCMIFIMYKSLLLSLHEILNCIETKSLRNLIVTTNPPADNILVSSFYMSRGVAEWTLECSTGSCLGTLHYRKVSNIRRTKYQNSNAPRFI